MKQKKVILCIMLVLVISLLSTSAFAVSESEVESAISASSKEEVAGNIFIWFLCAIGFLKVSQKIDSFMVSLGINVGRTGGSMLAELMVAGRAIAGVAGGIGGGNIFNRNSSTHKSGGGTAAAAGSAFSGSGGGVIGAAKRAVGNAAVASAAGNASGLSGIVGGSVFSSSLKGGGKFASDVIGSVAKGSISSVGSIKGDQAAAALSSYMGFSAADGSSPSNDGVAVPTSPHSSGDVVTLNGGTSASAPGNSSPCTQPTSGAIPQAQPSFSNVEIGGGRITGFEASSDGQPDREFAMYDADQYMPPSGPYDTVQTVDGSSWYRQYAQPTVEKTPYMDSDNKIKYNERIVSQMPQIPRRKDKV